jgi:hypothetical protein
MEIGDTAEVFGYINNFTGIICNQNELNKVIRSPDKYLTTLTGSEHVYATTRMVLTEKTYMAFQNNTLPRF